MSKDKLKPKECKFCGEVLNKEDAKDYGDLCSICYDDMTYCTVCEEEVLLDQQCGQKCRHVFWWEGVIWGCGSNEVKAEDHKESFFAVLNKIGVEAAKALIEGLKNQKFRMQYWGPIIGGGGGIDAYWNDFNYGSLFTENLTDAEEEKMSIGVGWFVSLEPGKTKEAEQITIKWTEEWLASKEKPETKREVAMQTRHAVESAIDAAKDPKGTWEEKAKKVKVPHWKENK